jgi:hypothetical protein
MGVATLQRFIDAQTSLSGRCHKGQHIQQHLFSFCTTNKLS